MQSTQRAPRILAPLVAAVVLLSTSACQLLGQDDAGSTPAPVVTKTVTAAPAPTGQDTPTPTPITASTSTPLPTDTTEPEPTDTPFPDEVAMEADITDAVRVVNGFWGSEWSTDFTTTYEPPTVVGLYDGYNDYVYCGEDLLGPDNAQYCPADNSVDWDSTFMQDGYTQIGRYWVYLIVAHEWGHAVVEQNPSVEWIDPELQADCLAGAALYGAATDGLIAFGPGATRQFATGLSLIGDDASWTQPTDHGDSLQRVSWFGVGRDSGVSACIDPQ